MKIWKINIPKSILILSGFAVVLNILRVVFWGKISFVYILWNIFLAFVPYFISSFLVILLKEGKLKKIIAVVGIFLWLIFIPNAPYLVTDLIHLSTPRSIPIIYDIFLLFSSAAVGLMLFSHSLFQIEQFIKSRYSRRSSILLITIIMIMISFGVYVGRVLRFNSWDIFINHSSLVNNIWNIVFQATKHVDVYIYTILTFSFLFSYYYSWKYSNIKE